MKQTKASLSLPLAVVVLAAGKGTRMKSDLPKVLHPVAGSPMLGHLLCAVEGIRPDRVVVVTGYGAEKVEEYVTKTFGKRIKVSFVRQTEQRGTGHAVQTALPALKGFEGTVIMLYGDVLMGCQTLGELVKDHASNRNGLTLQSAVVDDPTGLGRIFKKGGKVVNVEEKDCTPAERKVKTANPGIYAIPAKALAKLLPLLKPHNAQKELYLTDIIGLAPKHKLKVKVVPMEGIARAEMGINDRMELARMEALMQNRLRAHHLKNGVTMTDPNTVYFSSPEGISNDVVIHQHVVIGPDVVIESGVTILPFCHLSGCTIRAGATVGPFARLRSGTELGTDTEIGSFVITKKAKIGARSKAKQLSCLVDCTIGEGVNVGAGAVIANYHHFTKKKADVSVGDGASLGANSVLVAPVKVGKKAFVAATTTVRETVPDGALAITKTETIVKANYKPKGK
jgi:bifunctional UDP-N-acetylglucosamine pyrophosphorylase/glucosamine-1-phosphate N-acetyltransferase